MARFVCFSAAASGAAFNDGSAAEMRTATERISRQMRLLSAAGLAACTCGFVSGAIVVRYSGVPPWLFVWCVCV
jgi:hypothetical protein